MTEPLTPQDVQNALDTFDLGLTIQFHEQSTATSQEAADAAGCELGQIVKSLCFIVDGQPIVVLASGDVRIETRKVAALYEVGRKKVKTAKPEQCVEIYGYAPGSVPPLGHRTEGITCFIEDSLTRYEQLFAAAGAPNAIFAVTFDQLQAITQGQLVDFKIDA